MNILPLNIKLKLRNYLRLKKMTVLLTLFCCLLVIALIFLSSIYIIFQWQYNDSKLQTTGLPTELEKDYQSLTGKIDSFKKDIKALVDLNKDSKVYQVLIPILDNKGEDIKIDGLSFSYDEAINQTKVVVSGTAKERQSLIAYTEKLRGVEIFSKVDNPISNLIGGADNHFTLNVSVISSARSNSYE